MTPELSIRIAPNWEEIAQVRKWTVGFLANNQLPRDVVDAVSMVACELTENATKYGHFSSSGDRIDVRVAVANGNVTVEVVNPVAPDPEKLKLLDRMVQWIRGFQDPFEAYLHRLEELSGEGFDGDDSRLGLVRIAYEGQSTLDFYLNEKNHLAVSATRRL